MTSDRKPPAVVGVIEGWLNIALTDVDENTELGQIAEGILLFHPIVAKAIVKDCEPLPSDEITEFKALLMEFLLCAKEVYTTINIPAHINQWFPVEKDEDGKNVHAIALGHRGGLIGGPARARNLNPTERSEIARHAARCRWKKEKADVI